MSPDSAPSASATPACSWPDLPLVVEQLQEQIDGLREVAEAQQREIRQLRARLESLESR